MPAMETSTTAGITALLLSANAATPAGRLRTPDPTIPFTKLNIAVDSVDLELDEGSTAPPFTDVTTSFCVKTDFVAFKSCLLGGEIRGRWFVKCLASLKVRLKDTRTQKVTLRSFECFILVGMDYQKQ
mmetsp:Transcript_2123/g.2544  ORF Transcript_2123/g.2544 Transcript_2123/m.2544 type:complete len:128 (-) Transcript_2123:89-472(-)